MPRQAAPSSSPTFMDTSLLPWVLVSEVYWMSSKLLERRLYHVGISASQARIIALIHSTTEPIKPSVIALLLFQETQSVTGILHRIEAQGWVKRSPNPIDRRAVGLTLTPAGKKIGDEIALVSKELYNELFSDALSATERRQVEAGLRKIRARGFKLPETDFKLRRAQQFPVWKD